MVSLLISLCESGLNTCCLLLSFNMVAKKLFNEMKQGFVVVFFLILFCIFFILLSHSSGSTLLRIYFHNFLEEKQIEI